MSVHMPMGRHTVWFDQDAWDAAVGAGRKDTGDGVHVSAYLQAALRVRQAAPDWLMAGIRAQAHRERRYVEDVVVDALRAYLEDSGGEDTPNP